MALSSIPLAPIARFGLIGVLLFPQPSVADGCPDAVVVGVAGSGQTGFGEQVGGVVQSLVASASQSGIRVEAEPLSYPAISVSDSLGLVLFTGEYAASVASGAEELQRVLSEQAASCPSTESVLVGYSQGAEVIKRAFDDPATVGRIASVVLLADPTRDPDQAGVTRLGDPTAERPGAFGAIPIPPQLRPVTFDVCAAGDGICERGRFDLAAHVDGYGDVADEVVPTIVDRLAASSLRTQRPR